MDFDLDLYLERISRYIERLGLSPPVAALSLALCAGVSVAVIKRALQRRRRLPLPPGPRGLPLIGNVLDLPQEKPWEVYRDWAQKYGDVVYLEALGKPIIVLGSAGSSIELQEKRSTNYSGRPHFPAIDLANLNWNLGNMGYGSDWRTRRRLFHQHFNIRSVTDYEPIYHQKVPELFRKLRDDPIKFSQHIRGYLGLCLMRICYGVEEVDQYTLSLIDDAETLVAGFAEAMTPGKYLVNDFPILRYVPSWFPGAAWKRRLENFGAAGKRVLEIPFNNLRQTLRDGKRPESSSVALKIIEGLPNLQDDSSWNSGETIGRHVVGIAYGAGIDTSSGSALAFILALAMYPEVQRRAQAEIDAVVGTDRLPTLQDRPRLPYFNALFKESLRWHTMVPLAPVRASATEDEYNGYRIPANATVFTNNWALLHDPEIFEDPLELKPERFLKDGQLHVPTRIDPEYTAFGNGRRICPGRHLASDMLFVMLSAILATFDIKPPKDGNGNHIPLKLEAEPFFISSPLPFQCEIHPRSSRHDGLISALNAN